MSALRSIGLAAAVLAASGGVAVVTWSYLSARRQKVEPKTPKVERQKHSDLETTQEEPPLQREMSGNVSSARPVDQEPHSDPSLGARRDPSRLSASELSWGKSNKQVLVLGLDGSGKTSVLNSIVANRGKQITQPTEGFNAVSVTTSQYKMEFLEIGGGEQLRQYWNMYLPRAIAIIFVVDSADHSRLPLAKTLLHQLIQEDSLLPLMVLANKQDLKNAHHIPEIHEALGLAEIGENRKLYLIGTYVKEGSEVSSSIKDTRDLIEQLVSEDLEEKS
ncbi:ADP-ribosylation factor-like protein 9 isoform 1-T1 [Discoglossus pictus]